MATPKQRRPRAETPKGFRDLFGAEVAEREAMLRRIAEVYRSHGFDPLETSAVETVEALGKFLPDVDRPNEGVFAWQEEPEANGDWLALRYDLTAPLARVFAQHRASLPTPYRRYAMGPVWRNEKPGPGRFRQFTQCDADTVGSASVAADAEIVAMLCEALEAAGIDRKDYLVRVNNRKLLDGAIEAALYGMAESDLAEVPVGFQLERVLGELRDNVTREQKEQILRTIDKFDKVGPIGVLQLLTTGRKDESGAFIPGVGLSDRVSQRLLSFLEARQPTNEETLKRLRQLVGSTGTGAEGVQELETMLRFLQGQGLSETQVVVDPSVVRGLGYYTGPVFEAELTFEVLGEDGRPRQFGSVAGGGRYDDLVKRFTGESVPATGVSVGVDRLLAALRATGRVEAEGEGPIVVTVMDRDRVGDALALAAELRRAGLRAEAYLGNPKSFGAQLKYADRRRSPFALIEGSDERARGVVQVKDLVAGARAAETASLEEWKDRPAQAEVPRAQVAEHLKRLLAR